MVDGSFFQVIKADGNNLIIAAHQAPEKTSWILRTITDVESLAVQTWTFLDANNVVMGTRQETDFNYDPRTRLWYEAAQNHPTAVLSEPYVFNSLKQPGITASYAIPGGFGVAGVDLTLSSLQDFVSAQQISPNGGLALLSTAYQFIAASNNFGQAFQVFGGENAVKAEKIGRAHV